MHGAAAQERRTTCVERDARRPRNNAAWPRQDSCSASHESTEPPGHDAVSDRARGRHTTLCRIVRVADTQRFVTDLDAVDGTPVPDLMPVPVMSEFLSREPVRPTEWSHELMRE